MRGGGGARARSRRARCASCTRCCSRGGSTSAGTCSSSRASCRARSTPARATRARRSAWRPPWRRATSPRRCTATSALHLYRGVEPWRVLCQYMGRVGGHDERPRLEPAHAGRHRRASASSPGPRTCRRSCPVAVGAALAFRVRGEPRVALGWIGDGSSANGTAHESMNFAGVRRLPVVFVIDNNQFAYSTPTHLNFASSSLAARGPAYGFEGVVVDGTDVLAVYREARHGDRARALGRRADGARADDAAHGGPRRARRRGLRAARAVRALGRAGSRAPLRGLDARRTPSSATTSSRRWSATSRMRSREAVARAEASPWPDPDTLEDGVYAG